MIWNISTIRLGVDSFLNFQNISNSSSKLRTIIQSSGRTEKRKIKHVQYTGWPDFGITGHFNKIEAILDNLTDFLQDQPMMSGSPADYSIPVVHCRLENVEFDEMNEYLNFKNSTSLNKISTHKFQQK